VFDETLAREIARAERFGRSFALVLLDLDHFKDVNDAFGHQAGDAVLSTVAEQLAGGLRDADLAARYGGEEFAVILVDTSEEDLTAAVESVRCRAATTTPPVTTTTGRGHAVTASAGAALYPRHALDATSLIAAADAALYTAKAAGRDCSVVAGAVPARPHG
jgi:diguanylate cyclase (GGDEF)-like protein